MSEPSVWVPVCPSDGERVPNSLYGGISYPANAGSGINVVGVTTDDGSVSNADGLIFQRSRIGFRDVTDGTSNTASFGEQLLGDGVNAVPAGTDYRRRVIEFPMGTQTTDVGCVPGSAPAWSGQRGAKWINGHLADTMYNHYLENAIDP